MRRIALSLLILLACADVSAREVRLSSPDGNGGTEMAPPSKAEPRRTTPATRDSTPPRVRPSVHGDVGPRMRWHSFLPGMFR